MKNYWHFLLVFAMMFSFTACASKDGNENVAAKSEAEAPSNATFEEQIIVEEQDVKITVTNFDTSVTYPRLIMQIENNSTKEIDISAKDISVNGVMYNGRVIGDEISAGEKGEAYMEFSTAMLEVYGITEIVDIEFALDAFDLSEREKIITTDAIKVKVSDSTVQKIDDAGEVVYNENDIKVVVKKPVKEELTDDMMFLVYIENNTDNRISVEAKIEALNGTEFSENRSGDIVTGKMGILTNSISEEELSKTGKDKIEEVVASFIIDPTDDYGDEIKIQALTFTF